MCFGPRDFPKPKSNDFRYTCILHSLVTHWNPFHFLSIFPQVAAVSHVFGNVYCSVQQKHVIKDPLQCEKISENLRKINDAARDQLQLEQRIFLFWLHALLAVLPQCLWKYSSYPLLSYKPHGGVLCMINLWLAEIAKKWFSRAFTVDARNLLKPGAEK